MILVNYTSGKDTGLKVTNKIENIEKKINEMLNVSTEDPKEYDEITSKMKRDILGDIRETITLTQMECNGTNIYKDIDDMFQSMRISHSTEIEPVGDGFYKIDNMLMKIYRLDKSEPLKFEKKEVIVKWKLV